MIGNPTRVGDLAVLINVPPENLGVFVKVLKVDGGARVVQVRSDVSAIRSERFLWVFRRHKEVTLKGGGRGWIHDESLQPIRPNESPEAVDEVVEREVTA